MESRGRGVAAVMGAACAFGTITVVAKLAYRAGSTPATLLATRLGIAAVVLGAVALRRRVAGVPAGFAAGAAFAAGGFLEFAALERLPAPVAAVLLFLAPAWVAAGSFAVAGRRPAAVELALYVLALAGVAVLVGSPADPVDPAGVALAVAASALYGGIFVWLEASARRHGTLPALTSLLAGAAAVALVVDPEAPVAELANGERAACALTVGVLTALSLLLLVSGLRVVGAFSAALATGAEPAAVTLLSWPVLAETLAPRQLAGGGLVVACVIGAGCAAASLRPVGPTAPRAPGRGRRTSRGGTARPPR